MTEAPMDDYTPDEVREARPPIASLISKSEKAQTKLAPRSWQHAMLQRNLEALRIASVLMNPASRDPHSFERDELLEALRAIDSMVERTEDTRTKFSPGTPQHTLQRNRLRALRIAERLVQEELDRGGTQG